MGEDGGVSLKDEDKRSALTDLSAWFWFWRVPSTLVHLGRVGVRDKLKSSCSIFFGEQISVAS